eukprot:795609-Alexandrium_andersonii.AAC.1
MTRSAGLPLGTWAAVLAAGLLDLRHYSRCCGASPGALLPPRTVCPLLVCCCFAGIGRVPSVDRRTP